MYVFLVDSTSYDFSGVHYSCLIQVDFDLVVHLADPGLFKLRFGLIVVLVIIVKILLHLSIID